MSTKAHSGFQVPSDKITKYLLDVDHPKGGPKARFFMSFGFDPAQPEVMASALVGHLVLSRTTLLPETEDTLERMVAEGPIVSPDGRNPWVRSVWQREEGDLVAYRLITAVPLTVR